jgi:PST family polysaccharide transporter
VYVLGFIAGLPWGITGVAAIYAVLTLLLLVPGLLVPFRLIGLPLSALWKAVRPIAAGSAAMAAIVIPLRWLLASHLKAPAIVTLAACVAAGAAAYFLWMYRGRSPVLLDLMTLAGSRSAALARLAGRLREGATGPESAPSYGG